MIIEIDPLDTVIFRDGKPFGMGDDSWTTSLLFPTPTTIYGALRGTYFSQNPDDFKKLRENDITEGLVIKGVYLYGDDELLYIAPKDCVQRLNQDEITTLKLEENRLTSSPLSYNLSSTQEIESMGEMLFDEITFDDYLNGSDALYGKSLESYINIESKIGIGRDRSKKVTKEGLLYRVQMLRYEFKIVVEFEGLALNDLGLMKFGGEAKGATYKRLEAIDYPTVPTIEERSIFKLYLLTPAIFEKGWLPSWIDEEKDFTGEFKGIKLKLLSCATGKSQPIGGFDMKTNRPKEMLKTVPAGSVYYFEILESQHAKLAEVFHMQSISDHRANEGYGVTILSGVER